MAKRSYSNKKNSVESKLKAYSALAAGVIALAGNADAQILYNDINPDTIIGENSSYFLDLNKDGAPDFRISQIYKATSGSNNYYNNIEIAPLNDNNRVLNTSSEQPYPVALPLNASIGPDANFWDSFGKYGRTLNSSYEINNKQYNIGNWQDVTDKFVGLYMQLDGKKYYGWVRLDVPKSPKTFTVKDFAFNTVADEKINAGDEGSVGIKDNEFDLNTIIYSYYKDLYVNFNTSERISGKIDLFNTTGQLLKSLDINETRNHFIMEDVTSGIYIINIQTNKGNLSKKIRIE